jgi:hypothetical protein
MKTPKQGKLTIKLKFEDVQKLADEAGLEAVPEDVPATGLRIGIQMQSGDYDTKDILNADEDEFIQQGPIAGIMHAMADFLSNEETMKFILSMVADRHAELFDGAECPCPKCSPHAASKADLADMVAEGHA